MAKQTIELDENEIALAIYDWVNRNYPEYRAIEGKLLYRSVGLFDRKLTSVVTVETRNQNEH